MRIRFVILMAVFPLLLHSQVRPTVRECFRSMPDVFIPSAQSQRLDLIDYYDSGMRARVKGPFGNSFEITSMSDSYLRLTTSKVGNLQMKILKVDSISTDSAAYVMAVVRTVKGPAESSDISFYTLGWQPLTGVYEAPSVFSEMFWNLTLLDSIAQQPILTHAVNGTVNKNEILTAGLYKFDFNADDNILTVTSSAEKQLEKDVFKAVIAAFRPTIRYEWCYGRFAGH